MCFYYIDYLRWLYYLKCEAHIRQVVFKFVSLTYSLVEVYVDGEKKLYTYTLLALVLIFRAYLYKKKQYNSNKYVALNYMLIPKSA